MKKKYNVVIIEDDRIISELLKNKINESDDFLVVNTYENPVLFLNDKISEGLTVLNKFILKSNVNTIKNILIAQCKHRNLVERD